MSCNSVAGDPVRAERDAIRRLFNRLEAAVSHHRAATGEFRSGHDEALYVARDKVLRDYAGGNG